MKNYLILLTVLCLSYRSEGMSMSDVKNESKQQIPAYKICINESSTISFSCVLYEKLEKHTNSNLEKNEHFLNDLYFAIEDFGILYVNGSITDKQLSVNYSSGRIIDSKILQFEDDLKKIKHEIDLDEFKRICKEYTNLFYVKKASEIILKLIDGRVIVEGYALDGSLISK